MIDALIFLVFAASTVMLGDGWHALTNILVYAVPDIGDEHVIVYGRPQDVDNQVTYPLTIALTNATTVLGHIPVFLTEGCGFHVMQPMANPSVGGMAVSVHSIQRPERLVRGGGVEAPPAPRPRVRSAGAGASEGAHQGGNHEDVHCWCLDLPLARRGQRYRLSGAGSEGREIEPGVPDLQDPDARHTGPRAGVRPPRVPAVPGGAGLFGPPLRGGPRMRPVQDDRRGLPAVSREGQVGMKGEPHAPPAAAASEVASRLDCGLTSADAARVLDGTVPTSWRTDVPNRHPFVVQDGPGSRGRGLA